MGMAAAVVEIEQAAACVAVHVCHDQVLPERAQWREEPRHDGREDLGSQLKSMGGDLRIKQESRLVEHCDLAALYKAVGGRIVRDENAPSDRYARAFSSPESRNIESNRGSVSQENSGQPAALTHMRRPIREVDMCGGVWCAKSAGCPKPQRLETAVHGADVEDSGYPASLNVLDRARFAILRSIEDKRRV